MSAGGHGPILGDLARTQVRQILLLSLLYRNNVRAANRCRSGFSDVYNLENATHVRQGWLVSAVNTEIDCKKTKCSTDKNLSIDVQIR